MDLMTELFIKKSKVEGTMKKRRMATVALMLRVVSRKDCCRIWKMVGGDEGVVLMLSLAVKVAMTMVCDLPAAGGLDLGMFEGWRW